MKTITARELSGLLSADSGLDLIDVRTPVEFREIHAVPARNVPLDRLSPAECAREHSNGSPLYVICKSGNRGKMACETLSAAGVNVVNVEGGTQAWEAAGLPVVRGKAAMSLERQVRIAAGFLVLVGAVLGYLVHPSWIGLSAFVGAGLFFAGVTDTCGMGMIIARMPWNQVRVERASSPKTAGSCQTESNSGGPGCCG